MYLQNFALLLLNKKICQQQFIPTSLEYPIILPFNFMSEQDLQRQLDDNKESINKVSSLVENLAENHIAHLTNNVNDVQIILAEIKSDLKWIKIIGAFLILQAITVIIKLFVK